MRLTSGGQLGVGTTTPQASLHIQASSASTKPLIAEAAASQSANLQEWQNSSGSALSVVDANGHFGIGTASPAQALSVVGQGAFTSSTNITLSLFGANQGNLIFGKVGTNGFSIYSPAANYLGFYSNDNSKELLTLNGTNVGISNTTPTHLIQVTRNGAYSDGSTWNPASSIRWKENIEPLTGGVETLRQLHPVAYNYKKTPAKRTMGFIAEEVGKVLPTVVDWDKAEPGYVEGYDHLAILALAVEAVKEQQRTIEEQQKTIEQLQDRIATLERINHSTN